MPHTNVMERIKRGDPGRTETDKIALAHDLRYGLSKTFDDKRNADNIMIREVNKLAQNKGDNSRNILVARAIAGKVKLEDMGILKKDAFSGDLSKKNLSPENDALLTSALNQQGYGLKLAGPRGRGVILPGDALKIKLMKQIIKKKKATKKMKGGFFPFLIPIIALITEAISGISSNRCGNCCWIDDCEKNIRQWKDER
jgi:hypothetical protein